MVLAPFGREYVPVHLHNVQCAPNSRSLSSIRYLCLGRKRQQVVLLAAASPQPEVGYALHHELLARAHSRQHWVKKQRSKVQALHELLLVVIAALDEVLVPNVGRKVLWVLLYLCCVKGALGPKQLQHSSLESSVVLFVLIVIA